MKYAPTPAPAGATLRAVQEFNDFARAWVPPAVRECIWEARDNPVTRMVRAIKAIEPPGEPLGWGVYTMVHEPENRSRIEYVQTSLIFESPTQAFNARQGCLRRQPGDHFVICELREAPNT